jgi:hypothetical protein
MRLHRCNYAGVCDELFAAPGLNRGTPSLAIDAQRHKLYVAAGDDGNRGRPALLVFDTE